VIEGKQTTIVPKRYNQNDCALPTGKYANESAINASPAATLMTIDAPAEISSVLLEII
jgi:hypothetical protein